MPGQDMALKPITESELFDNFRQGTLATTPSKSSRTVASSTISQGAGTQYSSVIKSNGNQAATTPTPSPTRTATATVSAAVAIATENKSVFTNSQPESPLSSVALLSDSAQSTATPIPNSIGESFNSTDTMVALEDASVDESISTHSGQLESPLALPVSPGGYTSSAASAEYEEDTGSSGSELDVYDPVFGSRAIVWHSRLCEFFGPLRFQKVQQNNPHLVDFYNKSARM